MSRRIRTIKPEFWDDEKVGSLDPVDRLLFIGLWSMADDYGNGHGALAKVAGSLFAYDLERDPVETLARVSRGLASLSDAGFVTLYEVNGQRYFHVQGWSKHQKIDRPSKPRVPAPCETLATPSRESRETSSTDLDLDQGSGPLPPTGPAAAEGESAERARVCRLVGDEYRNVRGVALAPPSNVWAVGGRLLEWARATDPDDPEAPLRVAARNAAHRIGGDARSWWRVFAAAPHDYVRRVA